MAIAHMQVEDFNNFVSPHAAYACFASHVARGFTMSTAMVVTMVMYGSETYGADAIASLRDWVLNNTRGTDVELEGK